MPTRIGFYFFAGLVLGAVIGNMLPFAASLEAVVGGILAVILALILDKRDKNKKPE